MKNLIVTFIIAIILNFSLFIQNSTAQWTQTSLQNIRMECLSNCFGNIYAGTTDSGIYISTNNGVNWVKSVFDNTKVTCIYPFGNKIFAGTRYYGVLISADSGKTWTQTSLTYMFISSIISEGINLYAGEFIGSGIFKTTNNGANWVNILNFVPVTCLGISGNNMLATFYRIPLTSGPNGIYYSTNHSASWIESDSSATAWCYMSKDSLVYAGIGTGYYLLHGLRMSTNNGVSWTHLTSFYNKSIYYLGYSGNYIFAGSTDQGVYTSKDNFATWRRINEGLTDTITKGMLVKDEYLFIGTGGHGVWKRLLSEVTSSKIVKREVLLSFTLSQNYPNPFNPVTRIRYELPRAGVVRLAVYDVMGREVDMLVNERQAAGSYEATFDGNGFASGVYFYRMVTEGFTETKRMLLIK